MVIYMHSKLAQNAGAFSKNGEEAQKVRNIIMST